MMSEIDECKDVIEETMNTVKRELTEFVEKFAPVVDRYEQALRRVLAASTLPKAKDEAREALTLPEGMS